MCVLVFVSILVFVRLSIYALLCRCVGSSSPTWLPHLHNPSHPRPAPLHPRLASVQLRRPRRELVCVRSSCASDDWLAALNSRRINPKVFFPSNHWIIFLPPFVLLPLWSEDFPFGYLVWQVIWSDRQIFFLWHDTASVITGFSRSTQSWV